MPTWIVSPMLICVAPLIRLPLTSSGRRPPAGCNQMPSLRDEYCRACLVIASAGNLAGRLASPPQTAATASAPKRTNTTCPPALSAAHCRLHRPPHTYIVLPAPRGVVMRVHDRPKKTRTFFVFSMNFEGVQRLVGSPHPTAAGRWQSDGAQQTRHLSGSSGPRRAIVCREGHARARVELRSRARAEAR